METPLIWDHFATYIRLPQGLARLWWDALWRTQDVQVNSWRQAWSLHAALGGLDTRGLAHKIASPQATCAVLEMLWAEGVLTRQVASQIEEHVLAATDKHGRWMTRAEREQGALHG